MEVPLHEGFPVPAMSKTEIRLHATHARKILGLAPGRINIPELLDKLTEYGIYYDVFDRHTAPVSQGVEACYVPEQRTMYIRDSVFEQMANGGQRAVFTFGHELGHALLGHTRTLNRTPSQPLKPYLNSEWQANIFAAEFTMPLDQIRQYNLLTPEAMSRHCGVSPAAARVRLEELRKKGEI